MKVVRFQSPYHLGSLPALAALWPVLEKRNSTSLWLGNMRGRLDSPLDRID